LKRRVAWPGGRGRVVRAIDGGVGDGWGSGGGTGDGWRSAAMLVKG
jgi:hypothetical protein